MDPAYAYSHTVQLLESLCSSLPEAAWAHTRSSRRWGAGGMGEVYRARDPRMGREVAIKLSAERFSDRFEREVRAVAALNHANICQVYDVGPNYLVMELIEGPTSYTWQMFA